MLEESIKFNRLQGIFKILNVYDSSFKFEFDE